MNMFAPGFSRFWLSDDEECGEGIDQRSEDDARVEQQALEELAERVLAARSIV